MRGIASLQLPKQTRARSEGRDLLESHRLNLMGMLSINLRHFLADRLGPMLHFEDDSTLEFDPRWGDRAVRELARAIRRFSAERARELWRESAVKLGRLAAELARIPLAERHVVLCLRCGSICIGADAPGRHREAACLAVELNRALTDARPEATRLLTPSGIRRTVEDFRRARAAAGLPHFDLDCYQSGGQLVFTWRPLPSQSEAAAAHTVTAQTAGRADAAARSLRAERGSHSAE